MAASDAIGSRTSLAVSRGITRCVGSFYYAENKLQILVLFTSLVKLGFTGVYIIFLISAQNIDCGYSLEPPRRGGSNEYPQSMF